MIDVGARDTETLRLALVLVDTVLVPAQPRELDVWGIRVEQRAGAAQPCGVYSVYLPGNRPGAARAPARGCPPLIGQPLPTT